MYTRFMKQLNVYMLTLVFSYRKLKCQEKESNVFIESFIY